MGIRERLQCSNGRITLDSKDHPVLDRNGTLHYLKTNTREYCFETFDNRHCVDGGMAVMPVACPVYEEIVYRKSSFWLLSVSCVCLALTLIVYCCLSEMRNLHGRTLICHVSMMLLGYACLVHAQYGPVREMTTCLLIGYGIYFGFIATFFWLNIMCFDMWWKFSSMRSVQSVRKANPEWCRFVLYSLYTWSITIILTLTMFLLDTYPVAGYADYLDANIGSHRCWFASEPNVISKPHYIFFVIPMGVLTCTNLVLFLMTARHCARVKNEVHRLQAGSVGDRAKKRFQVDVAKYVLIIKLWVVMGAGWVAELAATLGVGPAWLISIFNVINQLQGVLIFLILVLPKLYQLIRKALRLKAKKESNSFATTSSTAISKTECLDEHDNKRNSQGKDIRIDNTDIETKL